MINGQGPDKGLYFAERITVVDKGLLENIEQYSNEEIAFKVIEPYVGASSPAGKLMQIVKETISFPMPLVKIDDTISTLELFHGPTLAFKDIGATSISLSLGSFLGNGQAAPSRQAATVLAA